jgi:chromosomal replication initiation ATPase DnaA
MQPRIRTERLPEQLTFDLPVKPALGRDAFFVAPSNSLAVERLENWRDWPRGRLVLCGPAGAGKTHLADVWAAETGAFVAHSSAITSNDAEGLAAHKWLVIEDAGLIAGDAGRETAMFHLYNLVDAAGGYLLLTALEPPSRWAIQLPDLKSRLSSLDIVTLEPPDDVLLAALLVKLFADRQIEIGLDLIPFLVARMDRSAKAAQRLVADLDHMALVQKKRVTRRLAAGLFQAQLPL